MDTLTLRKQVRQQRRALSVDDQAHAAQHLFDQLHSLDDIHPAQHIALYLQHDGEINPAVFALWAQAQNKQCYLPVLADEAEQPMHFAPYASNTEFKPNLFNIPEPVADIEDCLNAEQLDLILMPLVAFDLHGNRVGMGGGFYDRSLAFKRQAPYHQRPLLIGLAHEFQRIDTLEAQPWDVPLDGIATEQRAMLFQRK
ncbi:MAG: 5-formyltetrahydrofolate cyclo-ligase [Arenicellales bacterium]